MILTGLNFEPMFSHALFVCLDQVQTILLSLLHDASVTNLLRLRTSTTWLQLLATARIKKMDIYRDDAIFSQINYATRNATIFTSYPFSVTGVLGGVAGVFSLHESDMMLPLQYLCSTSLYLWHCKDT